MAGEGAGPLDRMRVVELACEHTALAGKFLAQLGAEVVLVEPRAGAAQRDYEPFYEDRRGPERSLWWWHYHTDKKSVRLDIRADADRAAFTSLAATADIVLEGERPGALAALGLDHPDIRPSHPGLIWVSITPFGRLSPRRDEHATDLTILAGGGPVWSCGYDDHSLPPVRGGGNQAFHTACLHAVASTLVAVFHRLLTGTGQHIDVSMHAASNVTTEAATYEWLVAQRTVQRQTGRHAAVRRTGTTAAVDNRGRTVNTGVPPRSVAEFHALLEWLQASGLSEGLAGVPLLEMGIERGGVSITELGSDPLVAEIFGAGRDALAFLASQMTDYEFFIAAQSRGIPVGVVYAPEEVMEDPHYAARGFHVPIEHEDLGRTFTYAGSPIAFGTSPMKLRRRAPHLGEHDEQILGPRRESQSQPTSGR